MHIAQTFLAKHNNQIKIGTHERSGSSSNSNKYKYTSIANDSKYCQNKAEENRVNWNRTNKPL